MVPGARTWAVGNTSDPATGLGQSPLRAPTVFNFLRPGYVPASTCIAAAALVAEINLLLAAGQLPTDTVAAISGAVQTIPGGAAEANRLRRVQSAMLLVLAAPGCIVQR